VAAQYKTRARAGGNKPIAASADKPLVVAAQQSLGATHRSLSDRGAQRIGDQRCALANAIEEDCWRTTHSISPAALDVTLNALDDYRVVKVSGETPDVETR
jgi:hypothetical protein